VADVLCLIGAWQARFGSSRRVVGMMHDLFIAMPIVGWFARGFGAVRADPAAAREGFARGYDVACFPGGDIDACRPMTAPWEVRFGPRRGYVRLALEAGVPIVPVVTIGSHFSYLVLPGSEHVARLARWVAGCRFKALPVTVGGLAVVAVLALTVAGIASPWWIAVASICALVPTPVRVTSAFLSPIDVRATTAHLASFEDRVELGHELVLGAIHGALRDMRHRGL
jgi:1-acyl-sn-glycerol-3-phosphate acyltransferase